MAEQVFDISFETSRLNEIDVHILPTEKFKTTTIVLMIEQALSEEHVTKTALLSLVLKRATMRFPDTKQLREQLDMLYGAVFDTDVVKKGERQILQVYMEIPNEKYLSDRSPLLEQAVRFVGEVVGSPYVEQGVFSEKYVNQEKESLRKRIESLIDDKMRYANQRITEEMFKGEPFALLVNGRVSDLPKITPADLYQYYQVLVAHNPINLFVVGDVERAEVLSYIDRYIRLPRKETKPLPPTVAQKQVKEVREVIDRLDVSQAKLNIGCRTNVTYKDDDYPALVMANGILGGFPHSKLFVNVREKESLAYYAVSRLESHKGVLMMMSGIDVGNYEKAVSIMQKQLELIKEGQISEEELNQTKATLSNQFRELADSARMMIDFSFNGILSGRPRTLAEMLSAFSRMKAAEVQAAAANIQVDTIYLLRDQKGGTKDADNGV